MFTYLSSRRVFPRLIMFAFLVFDPAFGRDVVAHVVSVSGKVLIRPEGNPKAHKESPDNSRPLTAEGEIYQGDIINTPSDGFAKLLLKDRTILDIGSSSLFHVNKFVVKPGKESEREIELSLKFGSVRAAVARKLKGKGKFKISTPAATMGVRGTEFVVKAPLHEPNQNSRMP